MQKSYMVSNSLWLVASEGTNFVDNEQACYTNDVTTFACSSITLHSCRKFDWGAANFIEIGAKEIGHVKMFPF